MSQFCNYLSLLRRSTKPPLNQRRNTTPAAGFKKITQAATGLYTGEGGGGEGAGAGAGRVGGGIKAAGLEMRFVFCKGRVTVRVWMHLGLRGHHTTAKSKEISR